MQTAELTNQINTLVYAVISFCVIVLAAVGAGVKWYIPARFKQQTEERETRILALKKELDNKATAEAVDIERERILPRLIESNISMSQSINQNLLQNAQQTAIYIAQLTAHDKQLTTNTDRLEELAQTIDSAIISIQLLKTAVDQNTDNSKTAMMYGSQAATTASEILELVKREINKMVSISKLDTGEFRAVADRTEIKKPITRPIPTIDVQPDNGETSVP